MASLAGMLWERAMVFLLSWGPCEYKPISKFYSHRPQSSRSETPGTTGAFLQDSLLYSCHGIGMAITKPWPQYYRTFVGRTEKACASKEAYKPDSVTPALSAVMGQNSPNLLWEACGRLPEMFEPSYSFFKLLTHKIFSCHTIFETSHSKCKNTHQISKTISYFSAFDSLSIA
jgi:hypothetical protein